LQLIKNYLNVISYISLFVILHKGHTCPKLQNPMLSKAEKNLLPKGKGARQGGWGEMGNTDPKTSPTVWEGSSSPEVEGSRLDHGFCDSAFRLRAEWQHCLRCSKIKWVWWEGSVLF